MVTSISCTDFPNRAEYQKQMSLGTDFFPLYLYSHIIYPVIRVPAGHQITNLLANIAILQFETFKMTHLIYKIGTTVDKLSSIHQMFSANYIKVYRSMCVDFNAYITEIFSSYSCYLIDFHFFDDVWNIMRLQMQFWTPGEFSQFKLR